MDRFDPLPNRYVDRESKYRRLSYLRESANVLRQRLDDQRTVLKVVPGQLDHHAWAINRLQDQLRRARHFVQVGEPRLEGIVAELRRLEAELG